MSVTNIGVSPAAWDYWEYLRRSGEAKQSAGASAMDAIKPVGKEQEQSAPLTPKEAAPAIPPERRNLFAQQLAATILEQEREAGEKDTTAAAQPFAAAQDKEESPSSGSSGGKIAVKSVTDGAARYIVGVRLNGAGEEVEVFRIPQDASTKKSPVKEAEGFLEMELLGNVTDEAEEKTAKGTAETPMRKLSAALVRQAQIAYGMIASPSYS